MHIYIKYKFVRTKKTQKTFIIYFTKKTKFLKMYKKN